MRANARQRSAKAVAITLAFATIAAACGPGGDLTSTAPGQAGPVELSTLESCERSQNEGAASYPGFLLLAYDADWYRIPSAVADSAFGLELARGADVYLHVGRAGAAALVFMADSDGRMYALGNCIREQTLDPLFASRDSVNADVDQALTEEEYFVRFAQSEELRAGFAAYLRG